MSPVAFSYESVKWMEWSAAAWTERCFLESSTNNFGSFYQVVSAL
ncbi:MAG: hypothetical protein ACE3JK_11175 [Sporolactobacillus sp.]